jgi:hypothetical protein
MGAKEWAEKFSAAQEAERKKRFAEKGYEEFWKPPQGVSEVEIIPDAEPRRSTTGQFGPSIIFRVRHTPKGGRTKVVDWAINEKAYSLLNELTALIAKGVTKVQVIRTGSATDTRYTVSEA